MEKEQMDEKPSEKQKSEPEKFTMSREEFHEDMKQLLIKQEAEMKQKIENKEAEKTPEIDAMKKKIADLESQLSTRTTATRDNTAITNGVAPMSKKTKEIRSELIGMAVLKTLKQNPDESIHILYENEQNLPPGAR
jgi:phage host-nuclease inhibitor protein Gam